jgi:hypothetical protein
MPSSSGGVAGDPRTRLALPPSTDALNPGQHLSGIDVRSWDGSRADDGDINICELSGHNLEIVDHQIPPPPPFLSGPCPATIATIAVLGVAFSAC